MILRGRSALSLLLLAAWAQSPNFPSYNPGIPNPSTVLTFASRRGFKAHVSDKVGAARTKSAFPPPLPSPLPQVKFSKVRSWQRLKFHSESLQTAKPAEQRAASYGRVWTLDPLGYGLHCSSVFGLTNWRFRILTSSPAKGLQWRL